MMKITLNKNKSDMNRKDENFRKDILTRLELFKQITDEYKKSHKDELFFNNEYMSSLKCSHGSEHANEILK